MKLRFRGAGEIAEILGSSMGDKRDRIVRSCANHFLSAFRDDNQAAMAFMKNRLEDRHKDKLSLKSFQVRFNCPELLDREYTHGHNVMKAKNWETVTVLMEIYLHQIQRDYDYSYSRDEMSDLAAGLSKNYEFFYPNSSLNGSYYPHRDVFYLYRVTDFLRKEYEQGFEAEVDNYLNKFDYNEDFIQALKDFPEQYQKRRNGSASLDEHTKTFVHEYLHLIYDNLDIKRTGKKDRRRQTVNEAYSWFISYFIAEEQDFSLGSPSSTAYDEPEKIETLSKLLLEKYREESDTPPVSFAIELQKEVYSSDKSQIEALVVNLMPEKLSERMSVYSSVISDIRNHYKQFYKFVEDYEHLKSNLVDSTDVDNRLVKQYSKTLEELEEDMRESMPEKSVDQMTEKMGHRILNNDKDWGDVSKIFYGTAMLEYRSLRSLTHDISRIERELKEIKDFDQNDIEERLRTVENRERDFLSVNSFEDLAANLEILQQKVDDSLEKIGRIKN